MSDNTFGRQIGRIRNEYRHSLGALVGIAQGIICDHQITDKEVFFLHDWLRMNDAISQEWPGDIVFRRVKEVISDGIITEDERQYLIDTLLKLIGSDGPDLPQVAHSTRFACDNVASIIFQTRAFCLTGNFVFGPRAHCEEAIKKRDGTVSSRINKKLHYVVIGSLGSPEWKHGSFGLKVEQAMKYKRDGCPIEILDEEKWTAAL